MDCFASQHIHVGSSNREDLIKMVEKLDDVEIDIAIGYVANLILSRAKPSTSGRAERTAILRGDRAAREGGEYERSSRHHSI